MKCSDLEAAQLAERQREEHIEQMSEFCFETVLSTDRNIKFLEKARQVDWYLEDIQALTGVNSMEKRHLN